MDLHHIVHWANGGRTDLENLISLCKHHHMIVHDRGYLIAAAGDGAFTVYRQDGTGIPPSPALPQPEGTIGDCRDADITGETIIPPWYGERLDLDHAIYVCFANARTGQQGQVGQERQVARDSVQVFEPEGWYDRIRQYCAEIRRPPEPGHPAHFRVTTTDGERIMKHAASCRPEVRCLVPLPGHVPTNPYG